jgi:hypothetical protein
MPSHQTSGSEESAVASPIALQKYRDARRTGLSSYVATCRTAARYVSSGVSP